MLHGNQYLVKEIFDQRNILKRSPYLSLHCHFILFVLRRVAVQRYKRRSSNLSTFSDIANCCKSSTNKWIRKLTGQKWPYDWKSKLWHLFRKIPNISKYKKIAFIVRNPGNVFLPEFPTSAIVYVKFSQMIKSCPMSNHSMTWTDSLLYLPVCQMKAPGIWLFVRTYILRKTCDEDARDITCPKPTDADSVIKKHCWCAWQWWTQYKEKEEEKMKNTLCHIADKNFNIACLYYLWLLVVRVNIICSRNVMCFPLIYTTIPPVTNVFSRSTCIVMK